MITSIQCYHVHSLECFNTFHWMFYDMLKNIFQYSLDCLRALPEYLRTFPRMFGDILWNNWWHSTKCLATFPGIFDDNPQNVWRHFPGYSIFPIPHVLHILFSRSWFNAYPSKANMDKVITDELFFIIFLINYLLIIKYQLIFKKVCEIFPTETGTCNQFTLK